MPSSDDAARTKEDIRGQFELFNIEASEEVLKKCVEMCLKYDVCGEEMVDQWFAYTTSVLRGEAPTVDHLEKMERKEFMKTKDQEVKKPEKRPQSPTPSDSPPSSAIKIDVAKTPKSNHVPVSRIQTPTQNRIPAEEPMEFTLSSPSAPSATYSKRTDARSVSCSHGLTMAQFKRAKDIELDIKPLYEDGMKPNQKIMCEALTKRGRCMNNLTEDLVSAIVHKYHLRMNDESEEISGNSLLYGRIDSNTKGKLNSQAIFLKQTERFKGRSISLNLAKVPKYSVFAGQVVAVKGSYLRTTDHKDKLVAEEIYTDTNLNLLEEPPLTNDALQMVVACGPFTTQDSLSFEPLNDLLQYVKEHQPHVLLLTGPFYERSHQGIHNGDLRQSFDSFFFDMVDNIMREVPADTHVIIVSSQREPHHYAVYPTPPYEVRQDYANLTFMPDPCLVKINGLLVGATTADIMFDLGNSELCVDKTNSGPPDRMKRLASHVLNQQSFYPLDPPGKDVRIDFSLMERHGVMDTKPHILILPSNFRHFIKEIDSCLVVNPERLIKGNGGGTFARIEIWPGPNPTVCGRTACQVVKI